MMNCSRCGVSEEEARLYSAIYPQEILLLCETCGEHEQVPLLKHATTDQLKAEERTKGVYERLSKSAGLPLDPSKMPKRAPVHDLGKKEVTLRQLVERKAQVEKQVQNRPPLDLIENWHWELMRTRREKKMTPHQLAHEIGESLTAVKMAESGKLPADDEKLIAKFEHCLGIPLLKSSQVLRTTYENPQKRLQFDPVTLKKITIADLHDIQKQRMDEPIGDLGGPEPPHMDNVPEAEPSKKGFFSRLFG